METIRNYLDTMFANLPSNPAVLKAKEVLWEMMEDKYNELLSLGKTENEAVGTVISEFGNLSELADALGLEEEMNASERVVEEPKNDDKVNEIEKTEGSENKTSEEFKSEENANDNTKDSAGDAKKAANGPVSIISASEAEELLKKRAESSSKISLGIALCILSLVGPISISIFLPDRFGFIGVILMFLIAGAGIVSIVYGGIAEGAWKGISKSSHTLSMDATKYVANEGAVYARNHSLTLTLGILLCVLSWIPTVIFSELLPGKFEDASAVVFFITLAIGVMLIVYSGMRKNGYEKLLDLNGKGTMKAEYKPESAESVKYISPVAEFFMSVYWPLMTCVYLILSFTTFKWWITWVIWPIAGILHKPLKNALTVKE